MPYSCLCRRPKSEEPPHESQEPMSSQQESLSRVIVETVSDEEETHDLLPATADTLTNARLPPARGVVYMFPRAWKERTMSRNSQNDASESTSYYSQYCAIS